MPFSVVGKEKKTSCLRLAFNPRNLHVTILVKR